LSQLPEPLSRHNRRPRCILATGRHRLRAGDDHLWLADFRAGLGLPLKGQITQECRRDRQHAHGETINAKICSRASHRLSNGKRSESPCCPETGRSFTESLAYVVMWPRRSAGQGGYYDVSKPSHCRNNGSACAVGHRRHALVDRQTWSRAATSYDACFPQKPTATCNRCDACSGRLWTVSWSSEGAKTQYAVKQPGKRSNVCLAVLRRATATSGRRRQRNTQVDLPCRSHDCSARPPDGPRTPIHLLPTDGTSLETSYSRLGLADLLATHRHRRTFGVELRPVSGQQCDVSSLPMGDSRCATADHWR